jgi:hypothetical protein
MSTTTLIGVADLRDLAAEALAPVNDTDPTVLVDVVDSLTPPALMLIWGDPWLSPGTGQRPAMGPCLWTARLQVLAVAGRLEPGPGIRTLEQLVGYVVDRLKADAYTWPLEAVTGPRVFDLGGLPYLGARVTYVVPITV